MNPSASPYAVPTDVQDEIRRKEHDLKPPTAAWYHLSISAAFQQAS